MHRFTVGQTEQVQKFTTEYFLKVDYVICARSLVQLLLLPACGQKSYPSSRALCMNDGRLCGCVESCSWEICADLQLLRLWVTNMQWYQTPHGRSWSVTAWSACVIVPSLRYMIDFFRKQDWGCHGTIVCYKRTLVLHHLEVSKLRYAVKQIAEESESQKSVKVSPNWGTLSPRLPVQGDGVLA